MAGPLRHPGTPSHTSQLNVSNVALPNRSFGPLDSSKPIKTTTTISSNLCSFDPRHALMCLHRRFGLCLLLPTHFTPLIYRAPLCKYHVLIICWAPLVFQRYSDDSKVVVNVSVEGSPGPVRTLVRLGATVEDTIKLVINRYSEEGRSPRLDVEAASEFELHHSYFSLESMNKTERIGEMGSRNFFLRRSCSSRSSSNFDDEGDGRRRGTDNAASSREEIVNANPPPQLFFSFIARRISKIGRRTKKIWNILGCMSCG